MGYMGYRIFFHPIGRNNIIKALTGERPPSISFYHESTRQRKSKDWKDEEKKRRERVLWGGDVGVYYLMERGGGVFINCNVKE